MSGWCGPGIALGFRALRAWPHSPRRTTGYFHKRKGDFGMLCSFAIVIVALLATVPLSGQIQNQPDDGQWTTAAKNFASTRFSTLTEINTNNVKNLKLA